MSVCAVSQSCLTLCDPLAYSPPGSSVHGILQARILEWVAISFTRGSAWPRDGTHISCTGRWILNHWATRKAPCTASTVHKTSQSWRHVREGGIRHSYFPGDKSEALRSWLVPLQGLLPSEAMGFPLGQTWTPGADKGYLTVLDFCFVNEVNSGFCSCGGGDIRGAFCLSSSQPEV